MSTTASCPQDRHAPKREGHPEDGLHRFGIFSFVGGSLCQEQFLGHDRTWSRNADLVHACAWPRASMFTVFASEDQFASNTSSTAAPRMSTNSTTTSTRSVVPRSGRSNPRVGEWDSTKWWRLAPNPGRAAPRQRHAADGFTSSSRFRWCTRTSFRCRRSRWRSR